MQSFFKFAATTTAVLGALTFGYAHAADVAVSGRIDTGFLYTMNHGQSDDSLQMTSGQTTGSRWTIDAREALTNDWTVKAHLESGFESDSGEFASSGRIFGRQMTLSLSNKKVGEIAFGRAGKPMSGSDQFTRISRFTPFGVTYGDAGLLFYGKGGRVDNGVFYKSPTWAGLTVVLSGSLNTSGDEASEWSDNTRFVGGTVDYEIGNFGLMLGAERIILKESQKAENQNENPTTIFVGTKYDFGFATIMAAYQRGTGLDRVGCLQNITISKPSGTTKDAYIENWDGDSFLIGAKIPAWGGLIRLSGIYVTGENGRNIANKNVGTLGSKAGYYAIGAGYTYPFSKRTSVYGVVAHLEGTHGLGKDKYVIKNDDGDLDRTQMMVGLVHKF